MNSQDLDILTKTVWGEARGEPREGKVAVAAVIMNRFNSRRWFGRESLKDTAQMAWQFSCWNKNDSNRAKLLTLDASKPSYKTCEEAVLQAEQGLMLPEWWTKDITHYYVKGTPEPAWAHKEPIAGEIGRHLFFRGID